MIFFFLKVFLMIRVLFVSIFFKRSTYSNSIIMKFIEKIRIFLKKIYYDVVNILKIEENYN